MKRIQLKQLIACALITSTLLCAGTISAKATTNDMQKTTEKHCSVSLSEQAIINACKNAKSESDSIICKVSNKIKNSNVSNTNEVQAEEIIKIATDALNKAKAYKDLIDKYSNADKVMISDALTNIRTAFELLSNSNKLRIDIITSRNNVPTTKENIAKIKNAKSESDSIIRKVKNKIKNSNVSNTNEIQAEEIVKMATDALTKSREYKYLVNEYINADKVIVSDALTNIRSAFDQLNSANKLKTDIVTLRNKISDSKKDTFKALKASKKVLHGLNVKSSDESYTNALKLAQVSRDKVIAYHDLIANSKITDKYIIASKDDAMENMRAQINFLTNIAQEKTLYANINDANEALKISEKSISELKNITDPINNPEKMTVIIKALNESRDKVDACQEFANSNKISNEEILKDLDSTVKTLEKQIETLNKFAEDAKKSYNNHTQI